MTENTELLFSAIVVLALEVFEFFAVRKESAGIFSPRLPWRLFNYFCIASLLFFSIHYLLGGARGPKDPPFWFVLPLLVIWIFVRPGTLVATSAGLFAYTIYGMRRHFIPWTDVRAVTTEWQEERLSYHSIFPFTGYTVGVMSRGGLRIVHTISLRRQARFLDVLREHVPASAFAPGLYDWHPERG